MLHNIQMITVKCQTLVCKRDGRDVNFWKNVERAFAFCNIFKKSFFY